MPLCPSCQTLVDSNSNLRLNFDLKYAMESGELTSSVVRYAGAEPDGFGDLNRNHGEDFMDRNKAHGPSVGPFLPEETGPWIPVLFAQGGDEERSSSVDYTFQVDSFDHSEDPRVTVPTSPSPEVNLRNVLSGLFAIIMGRNTPNSDTEQQKAKSKFSSEEFAQNESTLWSTIHLPSAPSLLTRDGDNIWAMRTILEAEPPQWIPDSASTVCMHCGAPFKPLTRGRHHCRFCGGIFCRSCSTGKCLLPFKFRERHPQRVCDTCYERLEPLQRLLISHVSNAAQIATHDLIDWTCLRAWLNTPVGLSMEQEIYKTANVLRSYYEIGRLQPERLIPDAILCGAKGLVILTVVKASVFLTYKLGTGLVVAQRSDGSWSAPSAIVSFGLGWGAQVGGELTDFVIVLRNAKAVKAFSSQLHFSLGAGLSAAVGPLGRVIEADIRAGDAGTAACYSYSSSKGAFLGVSLEGNIVATRTETNVRFYGDPYLTPMDILLGSVKRPRAAAALYGALHNLFQSLDRCHKWDL